MSIPNKSLNGAACCIGSACMMWRWGEPEERTVKTYEVDNYTRSGWPVKVAGQETSVVTSGMVGYCGLAGKPE